VFTRGAPEGLPRVLIPVYEATLYDLLKAYGDQKSRKESGVLHIDAPELYSMDDALQRLGRLLGRMPDWRTLVSFLPPGLQSGLVHRSAVAATFAATLELVRSGKLELRQDAPFGPIYLRSLPNENT
jgi:segregation and condensation protein A